MSRWLKNINQVLQNLDQNITLTKQADEEDDISLDVDLVEPTIASDQIILSSSQSVSRSGPSLLVEEILVRRGLLNKDFVSSELEEDDDDGGVEKLEEEDGVIEVQDTSLHTDSSHIQNESSVDLDEAQSSMETSLIMDKDTLESESRVQENAFIEPVPEEYEEMKIGVVVQAPDIFVSPSVMEPIRQAKDTYSESKIKELERQLEEQKSQGSIYIKEIKKLRKQTLKLNTHVEEMEREMNAQQAELERAAERMEKDRIQAKNDKERLNQEHATALTSMIKEHKGAIQALNVSHSKQIADLQESMRQAEESRAKEGGNLSLELSQSIHREQEALKKVVKLEDEKSTLEIHNSSLSAQISALQSRVDVLMQTTENITKQEREVEDQLEATLSLHARQMNQMQKREAALETTICQLVTELAKGKRTDKASTDSKDVPSTTAFVSTDLETSRKLVQVQAEVESLKGQLILEEQRSKTLLEEMESISQERVEETASNMERQKEIDHLLTHHIQTIAQLEKKIREYEMNHNTDFSIIKSKEEEQKQISELTHELVRQQTYTGTLTAEIATLKSRLRGALDRAETAEAANLLSSSNHNADSGLDMEMGSPFFLKQRKRRVGGGTSKSFKGKKSMPWIRRGMLANETIAAIMESIDDGILEATSYLRALPMARWVFLLYLVIVHLWIMVLVLFHAHSNLGSDGSHHGPHQLLRIQADHPSSP